MSTRELAWSIFDRLTDEQIEGFVMLFKDVVPPQEQFNEETIAALAETEEMKRYPEKYKGYTDIDEMFRDLEADD